MPRDGSNIFSPPAGTTATPGTTIESAKHNAWVADVTADLNLARPIVAGGTGATTKLGAQQALDLEPGVDIQAYDADLASWAGVTRASGFDTFAATPSSANLRALLTDEVGAGAAYFVGGALGTPASGSLANMTGLTVDGVAASTLVTSGDGLASNDNDTTIPTSAAVIDLVAAGWQTQASFNRVTDIGATTRDETFAEGYDYLVLARGMSRNDTSGLAVTYVFESSGGATDTEVLTIPMGVAASAYSIVIEIPDPISFQPVKRIMYSSSVNVAGALSVGAMQCATYGLGGGPNNIRTDRLNSISIDLPTAVDAGFLWILRRPRT